MMRIRLVPLALATAALVLPGCLSLGGGAAPTIRRHSLDLPSLTAPSGPAAFGPLSVRQFASRGRYELRVLAVDAPGRVEYLDLDRWAEDPSEALTTVVRERVAASGRFRAVSSATSEMDSELVLDGTVLAFDVLRDGSGPWRARAALRLEVTERRTGGVLHTAAYAAERALPGEGTAGLGSAMAECVGEIVDRALADWGSAQR